MPTLLFLRAYANLVWFEFYLSRGHFAALYESVRRSRLGPPVALPDLRERVCEAINLACLWYWKDVLCLQRAAATVRFLKRCGLPAQLVLGVQSIPFMAHAWVEIDGKVVNEKPYMHDIYTALDRF